MSRANIAKIERIQSSRSASIWVDLLLDKERGVFFADVGAERIECDTKEAAVKTVTLALDGVHSVAWRGVIVLRVPKRCERDESDRVSRNENGLQVLGASCSFDYMRRERAQHPTQKKEQIERMHTIDFEEYVTQERKHAGHFEHGAALKRRRDEREAELRQNRNALVRVREVWTPNEGTTDREIPYSDEAWAGLERIASTLEATQRSLDEYMRIATPDALCLVAMAGANPLLMLPAAPKPEPPPPIEDDNPDSDGGL